VLASRCRRLRAPPEIPPVGCVGSVRCVKGTAGGAPVTSGGFLGAPTPLNNGVREGSEPAAPAATAPAAGATPTAPVTAPGSIQGNVAPAAATAAAAGAVAASSSATSSASGNFVVQVGAVSDQTRAQQYQ
ncbi:endolytic peptidoglycan transglycosylase RlpA, partial [Klebsiella pneumoniae]|nr:endolytic peptidoglycan transglycosylase RlpA [Klebsiella pneumoniae]